MSYFTKALFVLAASLVALSTAESEIDVRDKERSFSFADLPQNNFLFYRCKKEPNDGLYVIPDPEYCNRYLSCPDHKLKICARGMAVTKLKGDSADEICVPIGSEDASKCEAIFPTDKDEVTEEACRFDELLPDEKDCRFFIQCFPTEGAIRKRCAPGTIFDSANGRCDVPRSGVPADCIKADDSEDSGKSSLDEELDCLRRSDEIEYRFGSYDNLPVKGSCDRFVVCSQHEPVGFYRRCDRGSMFDTFSRLCSRYAIDHEPCEGDQKGKEDSEEDPMENPEENPEETDDRGDDFYEYEE